MVRLSVVIVNWNGKRFLPACLSSLQRQTFQDFETILVDNGSSDGSVAYVQAEHPQVKLLPLPENLGFTGGNIAGYERAQGELIVLLNNDTEVHPKWLEAISKAAGQFPQAGSFASKMLFFDDRTRIDNCGFALTTPGSSFEHGRGELDGERWGSYREVFGASGGAVAYRREMLSEIGFLDPHFFMTYEDVDLAFRARLHGYTCIFVPDAIVYHHYRGTMNSFPARQVYYSQRNFEAFYLRNMPSRMIWRYLPQRIVCELGAFAYFAKAGRAGVFCRAKFDALRAIPRLLRERKAIQLSSTVSTASLRSAMDSGWLGPKWKKLVSAFRPGRRLAEVPPDSPVVTQ